jgi:membrane-associated protein
MHFRRPSLLAYATRPSTWKPEEDANDAVEVGLPPPRRSWHRGCPRRAAARILAPMFATARRRTALGIAAAVALAAIAASAAGIVDLPTLEHVIEDLAHTLGTWTYLLVGGLAFLETGAFVGLLAPGETAIVLGGVVAAKGQVELALVLAIAWLAATAGDLASFALGRRLGRPFLLARGPRFGITGPRLARVERFYDRHGAKAVVIGRFVGIVRAVSPFLAGSSGMALRAFLPWSVLGTAIWAGAFTFVGYVFWRSFSAAADTLTHAAFAAAAAAALVLAWRAARRR